MGEYYKLSVLRDVRDGSGWELFYFEIDGDKSRIRLHYAQNVISDRVLNSKLEKISEEDMQKAISESSIDRSYG